MRGICGVLFVGLVMSSAAQAQEWRTYSYPDPGFAIQFPAAPDVQTAQFKNAVGVTLPVTRYVVRQDGVQYTLSVVNYSNTNADALSAIGEAARAFKAQGKVSANSGARVNGSSGRELTITASDGSRSDIAIFFVGNRLYTAVGQALPPNPQERSADTARFQHSLQFPSDDGGFFGLFGARDRSNSSTAATTVVVGNSGGAGGGDNGGGNSDGSRASGGAGGGGGRSTATGGGARKTGGHARTVTDQSADAACVGKSAGDVVQLDTPSGPVAATCTLTARPNGRRSAAPAN